MSFEPFWVDYARGQGMHGIAGAGPDLVQVVENIGIGMETEGEWSGGGPMVWIHGATRIIAWVRGLPAREAGRAGAVRAWGIRTHVDDDVVHWPIYWDLLASGPSDDKLQELAENLAHLRRAKAPPRIGDEFVGLLSEAYRTRVRGEAGQTFYIPLEDSAQLSALAWFWLLGPHDPNRATLGPPRRTPAALDPPLTYAGQLGDGRRRFAPSAYVESKLFNPMRHGKVESAIQAARELRALTPAQLSETIDPPPPARAARPLVIERGAGAPTANTPAEEEIANSARKIDFRTVREWTTFALGIVQTLLLIAILWLLGTPPVIENTRSPMVSTATRGTVPQTATATATTPPAPPADLATDVAGVALRSALKTPRAGITYAKAVAGWIKSATPAYGRGDVARARTAALQIYALRHGCAQASSPVDGTAGADFYDAIHCLGRKHDPLEVLTSDQKLIDWLEKAQ